MFTTVIDNYMLSGEIKYFPWKCAGTSAAPKKLVFDISLKNSMPVSVLDIGFGKGELGHIIKGDDRARYWEIDGVDGYEPNCYNPALLKDKVYRNIWFGYAQDIPVDVLIKYNIICLLDVIEHLSAEQARKLMRHLLTGMDDEAFLFVSTPLWFYPQAPQQEGDLEEHLIGVPATSMMGMCPVLYAINPPLVGGFVYNKESLHYVDLFHPVTDKGFTYERGMAVVQALNCYIPPGVVVSRQREKP
jgi:hypothetical protein